ncbi:unnamed protein product, partial [Mesorhabditis belari]|uniref:Nucleoside phosphorylase domain-containing protein n=1 Tax=Mesorhabditis belari TaxID=2138241 RepID=A0AAF3J1E5_9BILA
MVVSSLVALVPLKKQIDHNKSKITREFDINSDRVLHIAGGNHSGIIIYKASDEDEEPIPDFTLSFTVWLSDGSIRRQETRTLQFALVEGVDIRDGAAAVRSFFNCLLKNLPRDNVGFVTRALKLMQSGYSEILSIVIDMKWLSEDEVIEMPNTSLYDTAPEVASIARVQEQLEHAFPNGLPVSKLAERLKTTEDEVHQFLLELEAAGIAQRVDDEWLRRDLRNVDGVIASHRGGLAAGVVSPPTIAIITHLFVEKQAIDAIITEPEVTHRYKSGGDSNAYTIGTIGRHRVVATKLAVVGDSREATTSSGSITTRLLGNFQHIEHVFVVGVGGGVPHLTDAKKHARLGDVVVSSDATNPAYLFAQDTVIDPDTGDVKDFVIHRHNPLDRKIANVVGNGGETLFKKWETHTQETIKKLNSTAQTEDEFSKPSAETDVLFVHVGGGDLVVLPHPNQNRQFPLIHLGSIGGMTARRVDEINEDEVRDLFASEFGVRALDAGFETVISAIEGSRIGSWALIRGIADYQHGHSRAAKLWQAHAAARAAAMTQTIIENL